MVALFSRGWSSKTLRAVIPIYHGGVTVPWSANDGYVSKDVPIPSNIVKWVKDGDIWVVNSFVQWSLGVQPWTGVELKLDGDTVAKLDNSCFQCASGRSGSGTTNWWGWMYRPSIHVEVHAWKNGVMKVGQGTTADVDADLIIEYKVPEGEERKYTYWQTTPMQELLTYAKWGFISALAVSGTVIAIKIIKLIRGRGGGG